MGWAVAAAVLSSLAQLKGAFDPEKGGGVGGATSAQVQGGQTGLQYQDVAGTDIIPFEYTEYQEQLAEEEEQRQIAEAMALAQQQGLWSGGLISLMQGGPLYANQGLEIEDYFPDIEFARKSVTPLPGGGRAARQERQREGTLGITPFTYQPVAGGGALGRSMFAQNYMPQGGAMQGPGGPKSDLIPVMASDGEYMLSKAAVDQAGGGNHARGIANLEQFNRLGNRRYG
jgi:hypothetical protein